MSDRIILACDVPDEEREYIWYPYLTRRNINIFGGKTGTGKTWALCAIMSAITRGQTPPGMPGRIDTSGNVLYLGNEDGNGEIKRRLESVGADTRKIYLQGDPYGLDSGGLSRLEADIERSQAVAVFFDPITDYLPAGIDINSVVGVRELTKPLRKIARERDLMLSYVVHPPKGAKYGLLDQFSGSGALVDSVREATFVGYHPTDPAKRVIIQPKNNINFTEPAVFTLDRVEGFSWSGSDSTIKEKDIAQAERITEADRIGAETVRIAGLLTEVVKVHPKGLDMKATDLLKEIQRLDSRFQMAPSAFGKHLQDLQLARTLNERGITLKIGSKTGNVQRYNLYSQGQISVLP